MLSARPPIAGGLRVVPILLAANLAVLGAVALGLGWLVIAAALAVPLGLAVVRRPQTGILALVALTPFAGLVVILPVPPNANFWKEALMALVVVATFVCPESARGRAGRPHPPWLVAVVALVAIGVISGIVVGGVQAVAGLKISFYYLAILIAVRRCPLDARERDRLVSILMVVGLITAVFGLIQQVLGPVRLNELGFEYNQAIRFAGSFMRSFSTFIQPFGFGFFLMFVLLIGIPVALDDTARLRNQLFLLASPIYGVALATTIVRGAWLGLAVGLIYLGSSRYRALLLAIPLALVALLFLPSEAAQSALSRSSSVERAVGWQANVARVASSPLGEGIGSTGAAALAVVRLGGDANTYQTDNYYFKIMLEQGLVGLWLFLLLLASVFVTCRRAASRLVGSDRALCAGSAAGVLAAAVACFVASYFDIFPMDMLFWLMAGIAADLTVAAAEPGMPPSPAEPSLARS